MLKHGTSRTSRKQKKTKGKVRLQALYIYIYMDVRYKEFNAV